MVSNLLVVLCGETEASPTFATRINQLARRLNPFQEH